MTNYVPNTIVRNAAKLIRRHVLNPNLSWEKQRSRMKVAMASARTPKTVALTKEMIAGVPCEILVPTESSTQATLVHIHGGGFTVGSPASCRLWAAALCNQLNVRLILPDYSLAPECSFPQGLNEVAEVVDSVIENYGATHVAVSGDSACGNLALALTQRRVSAKKPLPAGLVLLSPWLDLSDDRLSDPALVKRDPLLSPEWLAACAVAYAPAQAQDPEVSPLLGSFEGLPPILVQGGTDDVLAPDASRLVRALDASKVSYSLGDSMWHDFALQVGMLAGADQALEATKAFLVTTLEIDGSVSKN